VGNVTICVFHHQNFTVVNAEYPLRQDERQRVYRRLLSVMEHLIKLNNFSSAFALFAALCKTAVRRVVNLSSKQEKVNYLLFSLEHFTVTTPNRLHYHAARGTASRLKYIAAKRLRCSQ
jgi:hypothetical protein